VFSSVFVRFDGPVDRRYRLRLKDVRREGVTRMSWRLFAYTSQNPIRYLSLEMGSRENPISITDILDVLDPLQERCDIRDIRKPPDDRRKGRFRQGWKDAADRRDSYKERALKQLTWQNLGNRFGKRFGPRPSVEIDAIYEYIAMLFQENQAAAEVEVSVEGLATEALMEGFRRKVTVDKYIRSRKARRQCLEYYGVRCVVCNVSLMEEYGPQAEDLIHVHHLHPISRSNGEYEIDPVGDLVPVCPNCHAVIHNTTPLNTIDKVRAMRRRMNRPCSNAAIPRTPPTENLSE
jgi:hypothetical protein